MAERVSEEKVLNSVVRSIGLSRRAGKGTARNGGNRQNDLTHITANRLENGGPQRTECLTRESRAENLTLPGKSGKRSLTRCSRLTGGLGLTGYCSHGRIGSLQRRRGNSHTFSLGEVSD